MATEPTENCFVFVVDTDSYAGGFERQLCAFATGSLGDCRVGKEEAEIMQSQYPDSYQEFADIILQVADENQVFRPNSIWPTPGYYTDGLGGVYTDADDPEMVLQRFLETMRQDVQKKIEYYDKRIAEGVKGFERDKRFAMERLQRAEKDGPGRFRCYHSVAIFFKTRPSLEQIEFLKERAKIYADAPSSSWVKPFQISGFRLVDYKVIVQIKEEKI